MTPRIIFEGDEAAAKSYLPQAQNLLHKARALAAASGSDVTGLSLALSDTAFAYTLKVGNTEVIHIYSQPQSEETPLSYQLSGLPDILNGVTKLARLVERKIKDSTILVLDSFKANAESQKTYRLPAGFTESPRLGVKPHKGLPQPTIGTPSQYQVVVPSNYSGLMRKLVQFVLGYGHLRDGKIMPGPDEADTRKHGLQVQYDSRWHRCHTLYRAEDKRLWLVEVSINNGVLAMPLEVYPKSRFIENSSIPSLSTAGREFGGLPTGRSFPTGKALKSAIARGEVLRLLDRSAMDQYFNSTPFSTVCGWSTNERGNELHNTGWKWQEDGQFRLAEHWRIDLRIGPLKKRREPNEPIADGSAKLTRVSSRVMYYPSRRRPPPLKFYEPLVGGLLSVQMTAANGALPSFEELPKIDCTVHVCHEGDDLRVVNYFWDRTPNKLNVEDTTEDCMFVGSWVYRTWQSNGGSPTFYTTTRDDRGQDVVGETLTTRVGTDMGWFYHWGVDSASPVFPQWGSLWRMRVAKHSTTYVSNRSTSVRAAIVVPEGLRDGYVYARLESVSSYSESRGVSYKEIMDDHAYQLFQYFYSDYGRPGECWARFRYKVYAKVRAGDACSELVSGDDWKEICDDGQPEMRAVPPAESSSAIKPESLKTNAWLLTDSHYSTTTLKPGNNHELWLAPSPDTDYPDIVQQMRCRHSALGPTPHMTYQEEPNGALKNKGALIEGEGTHAFNFVGVL